MKEIYNGETVALGGPNLVTKELVVDEATGKKAKFTYDKTTGAIAVLDEVDDNSINPVTSRAVAAAIEEGGGGGGTTYTAGDGISIENDEISAKVDGTTIQVNADGELEAIGGGGGNSYTAGDGISITNDEISVALVPFSGLDIKQGGLGTETLPSSNEWRILYNYVEDPSGTTGRMYTTSDSIYLSASSEQTGCKLRFALGTFDPDWGGHIYYIGTQNLIDIQYQSEVTCLGVMAQQYDGLQDSVLGISQDTAWTAVDPDAYWGVADSMCIVAVDNEGNIVGSPLTIDDSDSQFFYMNSGFISGLEVTNKLPSPGSDGQVLKLLSGNPAWADLQGTVDVISMNSTPNSDTTGAIINQIDNILMAGKIPAITTDNGSYKRYWTYVGHFDDGSTANTFSFQIPNELRWNSTTSAQDLVTETLTFTDDYHGGYTFDVKQYVLVAGAQGQSLDPFSA